MKGKRIKDLELRQASSLDNHKYWEIVQWCSNEWYHQYDKVEWDESRGMYKVKGYYTYYMDKNIIEKNKEYCYTLATFKFYRDNEEYPDMVSVADRPFQDAVDMNVFKKLCNHFYSEYHKEQTLEEEDE